MQMMPNFSKIRKKSKPHKFSVQAAKTILFDAHHHPVGLICCHLVKLHSKGGTGTRFKHLTQWPHWKILEIILNPLPASQWCYANSSIKDALIYVNKFNRNIRDQAAIKRGWQRSEGEARLLLLKNNNVIVHVSQILLFPQGKTWQYVFQRQKTWESSTPPL